MLDPASTFRECRKAGAGWTARCPAHDDKRNSLSIGTGENGKVLLHCHAGCETDDILAAAHLEPADLFPDKTTTKATIVATYRYEDAGGKHLYDVCRFAPKDFRQRAASGAWTMAGVPRVLYRLPQLQGRTVAYMAEGEKDVDRLRALGLTATCNAAGAGKWRPEYVQQLQAATVESVVILPDNDDPGRAHAQLVATACHHAGLNVKVVTLPDVPVKGDISDWLDAGHTKAELVALVKATPIWTMPAADVAPLRQPIITFLNTVQPEDVRWIWPGRFARRKFTLVAGEPGIGKTFALLDATARMTKVGRWPDGAAAPIGNVVWLTAEDGLADTIRPRVDQCGGDASKVAVLEGVRLPDGSETGLSLVRDLDMFEATLERVKPVLVVMDPINSYLGDVDTHRDNEVRSALMPVLALLTKYDCGLAAICHLSKDTQRAALHRPGGSIAFVAAARLVLAVAADPQDPARRILAPIKGNLCKPAPALAYRVVEDHGLTWEAGPVADVDVEALLRPVNPFDREERTDADVVIRDLIESTAIWPLNAKEALAIGQAKGIPERTLQRAAGRAGIQIRKEGFGPKGRWVWLRPPIGASIDATSLEHPDVAPLASLTDRSDIDANNNKDAIKTPFPRAREDNDDAGRV